MEREILESKQPVISETEMNFLKALSEKWAFEVYQGEETTLNIVTRDLNQQQKITEGRSDGK